MSTEFLWTGGISSFLRGAWCGESMLPSRVAARGLALPGSALWWALDLVAWAKRREFCGVFFFNVHFLLLNKQYFSLEFCDS